MALILEVKTILFFYNSWRRYFTPISSKQLTTKRTILGKILPECDHKLLKECSESCTFESHIQILIPKVFLSPTIATVTDWPLIYTQYKNKCWNVVFTISTNWQPNVDIVTLALNFMWVTKKKWYLCFPFQTSLSSSLISNRLFFANDH